MVAVGSAAICVIRGVFRKPPNDLLEAVKDGSLFSDVLNDNWRHQLDLYKIVSFYEADEAVGELQPATPAPLLLRE